MLKRTEKQALSAKVTKTEDRIKGDFRRIKEVKDGK